MNHKKNTGLVHSRRSVVLGHTRLSWGEQDSNSPARQANAIQTWAKREQFEQVELFADVEGRHSGRRNEGRPEWARLLRRLDTDPTIAVVVVESIDRLFRNLKLLQHFVDDCVARGVRFVSIAENFDFKPPSQADNPLEEAMRRLALQQFGALAEAWSNMTSAKMKMHVQAQHHKGKHWGRCPLGTQLDRDGKLIPAPDTYPALAELYQLYANRVGGWAIVAEQLNEQGYTARDKLGNPRLFTREDVRLHIDQHLTYAGHIIEGRSQQKGGPKIKVENAWEPILPLALIQAALDVRQGRTRLQSTPERRNVYPLTPLVHCSMCGQQLSGQREVRCKGGERRYRHSHKGKCRSFKGQINADTAERAVIQLVADLIPPPSTWELLSEVAAEVANEDAASRERIARINDLRDRKAKLQSLYMQQVEAGLEAVDFKVIAAKVQTYNDQIEELEAGLAKASDVTNFRGLMSRLADTKKLLERASLQTHQEVFGLLFEQLDISLSTGSIAKYKPREWLRVYINSAIGCAWREPCAAIAETLHPFVSALALAA